MQHTEIIEHFQARGRKTFTIEDIASLKVSRNAARLVIASLRSKGYIKSPARGFYVILSPSERRVGQVPPDTYIDQWMHFKNIDYYVGLLSAASFYGATHHRPMVYQVVTSAQITNSSEIGKQFQFHCKKHFPSNCLEKQKGRFGYITFSSPALTCYDVVKYGKHVGTLSNAYLVLSELSGQFKKSDFKNLLKNELEITVLQRLGFLLDNLGEQSIADVLHPRVAKANVYVPLSLIASAQGGKDEKWKLIINHDLENQDAA